MVVAISIKDGAMLAPLFE
jgi:hypothetical protein